MCGFIAKEKEDRVLLSCENGIAAGTVAETHGATGANNLYAFYQISPGAVIHRAADFDLSEGGSDECN